MSTENNCCFSKACAKFDGGETCTKEKIETGQCEKPTIPGLDICLVRPISIKNLMIAIISICPNCLKIHGVVSGDEEAVNYNSLFVRLRKDDIAPKELCDSCKKQCLYSSFCPYEINGHTCTTEDAEKCKDAQIKNQLSLEPCPLGDGKKCEDINFRAVIPPGSPCHLDGKCLKENIEHYEEARQGKITYMALFSPVRRILRELQRSTGV